MCRLETGGMMVDFEGEGGGGAACMWEYVSE